LLWLPCVDRDPGRRRNPSVDGRLPPKSSLFSRFGGELLDDFGKGGVEVVALLVCDGDQPDSKGLTEPGDVGDQGGGRVLRQASLSLTYPPLTGTSSKRDLPARRRAARKPRRCHEWNGGRRMPGPSPPLR